MLDAEQSRLRPIVGVKRPQTSMLRLEHVAPLSLSLRKIKAYEDNYMARKTIPGYTSGPARKSIQSLENESGTENNPVSLDSSSDDGEVAGTQQHPVTLDSSSDDEKKNTSKENTSGKKDVVNPEAQPPGPLTDWEYEFPEDYVPPSQKDSDKWRKYMFPDPLYPISWAKDSPRPGDTRNIRWSPQEKGYPHDEETYFRVMRDDYETLGNCYFAAISALLYGSISYWAAVKGDHLAWVDKVLRNKDSERFELYTRLNSPMSRRDDDDATTLGNLWMRLNEPYAWQSNELLQVTADLYDLFIVCYEMEEIKPPMVKSVMVRGNYNAKHRVLRFVNDNHFQPMRPVQGYSDWKFPEITRENTAGSPLVPKGRLKGATDLNHPWRSPGGGQEVPDQLIPSPQLSTREMTAWEKTLVMGFNTSDSGLNRNKLAADRIAHRLQLGIATESRKELPKISKESLQKDKGSIASVNRPPRKTSKASKSELPKRNSGTEANDEEDNNDNGEGPSTKKPRTE